MPKQKVHIEPVLRMIAALTLEERAAVKRELDKFAWEEKILTAEASEGGVVFTGAELSALKKLSPVALAGQLTRKANAKRTLQTRRAHRTT